MNSPVIDGPELGEGIVCETSVVPAGRAGILQEITERCVPRAASPDGRAAPPSPQQPLLARGRRQGAPPGVRAGPTPTRPSTSPSPSACPRAARGDDPLGVAAACLPVRSPPVPRHRSRTPARGRHRAPADRAIDPPTVKTEPCSDDDLTEPAPTAWFTSSSGRVLPDHRGAEWWRGVALQTEGPVVKHAALAPNQEALDSQRTRQRREDAASTAGFRWGGRRSAAPPAHDRAIS